MTLNQIQQVELTLNVVELISFNLEINFDRLNWFNLLDLI